MSASPNAKKDDAKPTTTTDVAATQEETTKGFTLNPPTGDDTWSSWYKEQKDTFSEFHSFDPTHNADGEKSGLEKEGSYRGLTRSLSARQVSGQFEEEVAQTWDEGWEDEDPDDTFDAVMGKIARHQVNEQVSAAQRK